jgi:NitT/TauT family transport system substrate-binding protein
MTMKKIISMLCAVSMAALLLAGCKTTASTTDTTEVSAVTETADATETAETTPETEAPEASAESVDMNIMALKGPTAMGMVSFMDKAESGEIDDNNYNFSIAASIDEVTPKIVQGDVDIAAVPANVASVLYNNTDGEVQVLAINTLGVLYIVENGDSIASVEDLKGKTIYASGNGATPEYALRYILTQNGIDPDTDVTIEWKSEHTECLSALLADDNAIAMLPQPFVTTAQSKSENIRVALDLTEEWDKLQENADTPSALLTGVVVVRKAFAEEHPEAVSAFLDHYKESVEYVNANVTEAAQLIEKYDIVTAEVAEKALPACNITFIEGTEMQEKLSGYLAVLFEQNAKSVGGALPDDDFYYAR